jgi:hypothetical protein
MKVVRLLLTSTLVAVVATVSSCTDSVPTQPVQQESVAELKRGDGGGGGWDSFWNLVDSCASLPYKSVTKTIDRNGGIIVVGPDTLIVPPNALTKPVAITATLPGGYFINVVQFQPEGLRFKKSATLIMGYSNCNILNGLPVRIAHVDDYFRIIEYVPSIDNRPGKKVYGSLKHFSNYAIAW